MWGTSRLSRKRRDSGIAWSRLFKEVSTMTEDELFNKAWLFLYAAAEEEIGFEVVEPVESLNASHGKEAKEQTA